MINKEKVIEQFKSLDKKQQQLVLYRILLHRFTENRRVNNDKYKKVMVFMLSLESFFLRSKEKFIDLVFAFNRALVRDLDLTLAFNRALVRDLDRDLDLNHDRSLALNGALDLDLALALARDLDRDRDLARDLDRVLDFALALARDIARDIARNLNHDRAHDRDITLAFNRTLARNDARDLIASEIDFVGERAREESEANLLYIKEVLKIDEMMKNPFLRLLYDKGVDDTFVEMFAQTLKQIDIKRFESSTYTDLVTFMREGMSGMHGSIGMARVIVLGNGNAGKTSLIKKLVDQKQKTTKEKITPRIEISHDTIDGVEVDYWDFGGQVLMHSTHTFFMTEEAVYVIVCNARADEQPDSWLETLNYTLSDVHSKVRVLIVYTYLDSKTEIEHFDKYRKNAMQRKYAKRFELSYHLHSSEATHKETYKRLKNSLREAVLVQGKKATFQNIRTLYKKKAKHTFIKASDIMDETATVEEIEGCIRELLRVGYIFPIHPSSEGIIDYRYDAEDIFVWQKHWLTYGVYELINHKMTKEKAGFIEKSDFKKILFDGKKRYILKNGYLQKSKPRKKGAELIEYNEEGIDILYNIVRNYKWAIVNAKKSKGLIFPHAVKLDEPDENILNPYTKEDDDSIVLSILLDRVPVGFFFGFVTLADTHIHNPQLLWRNGVVLFDQMDAESFAYVQMHAHKMEIVINGSHKHFLMQFILYYIAMLTREDKQSYINPKVMKRIRTEHGYKMIDLSLMSALSDEEQRDKLLKDMIKGGINMATINFNDKVDARGSAFGDGNTVNNYNQTVNYIAEAKEILSKLEDDDSKALVVEADEILASKEETETWKSKAKSFGGKVLKHAKNITVIDKASGVVTEYGASLMEVAKNLL